ncbi:unnamed protein product, partial [Oppiella nova]
EPGEHASCGNGLMDSGFSYDPILFMENNDYSIVSDEVLLDMVKVLTFALTEGKVAVHCHAGLGRTGVLIASYMVFAFRCKPHDAIRYVRSKRPNSIQTRGQILSVLQFSQYVVPFFVIYQHIIHRQMGLNLAQILHRQRLLLHGYELRHLKYIPKIIYVICERLLKLCGRHKAYSRGISISGAVSKEVGIHFQLDKSDSFCKYFFSGLTPGATADLMRQHRRPASNHTTAMTSGIGSPETYLTELDDMSDRHSPKRTGNATKSHKLMTDRAESSPQSGLPPVDDEFLIERDGMSAPMRQISRVGIESPKTGTGSSQASSHSSSRGDDSLESSLSESLTSLIESLGYRVVKIDSSQMVYEEDMEFGNGSDGDNKRNAYSVNDKLIDDEFFGRNTYYNDECGDDSESTGSSIDAQCSSGFVSTNCGNSTEGEDYESVDNKDVIKALLADYMAYNKPFGYHLLQYQKDLNTKPMVWQKLSHEMNVQMLCALLWSWIDSLAETVLTKTSLCHIVVKAEKPLDALLKLDQSTRYTAEYLLRFIARLGPEDGDRVLLIQHLMARLTRQRFKLSDGSLVPEGRDWAEMRKGTTGRIMVFIDGIYHMITTN